MGRFLTEEELRAAVRAYYDHAGNKSHAAEALGLDRTTYHSRLKVAEKRLGLSLGRVADGQIEATESEEKPLPRPGVVHRYILTSIQNNTYLHPAFKNLVAYSEWLNDLPDATCQLMVGTYSYQIGAYGAKAVKRGTYDHEAVVEELWYAREALPYIVDHSVELAPALVWCGEQNILPTTQNPLTGMEIYNGRKSNIVPHATVAMDSVMSMPGEAVKLNFSTGTMTQRNYIQKSTGIKAEQRHTYGATLAEVDENGDWWVRQLTVGEDNSVMDVGPRGSGGVCVIDGEVMEHRVVDNIYWGDVHEEEMHDWVRELAWGDGGMLDTLRPDHQCLGDFFSMHRRGHHEINDFHKSYEKFVAGTESVEQEVVNGARFLAEAHREWCQTHIVPSNHDEHLDKWLNTADPRKDLVNARYFHWLQYHLLDAKDRQDDTFDILKFACEEKGAPADIDWVHLDDSLIIGGVENALHGDRGKNGSRGSTTALTKLARRVNKGHDHTAAIRQQVFSSGACRLRFSYMHGPHTHSISHILTYLNGERAIITFWKNKWRA
jgi:hypothetical protein